MKIKIGIIIFITVLAILGGNILNFREFINDYWPVTIKNVIVTASYIVTWVIVISISIKYKYFRIIKVYSVFWFITFILAVLLIFNHTTGAYIGWAILPTILCLCPWYGLAFYINDNTSIAILIAICSVFILVINNLCLRSNSKHKHIP